MMDPAIILVVDDEPFNLDYIEQELEGPDYKIITASNGEEALAAVEKESPDVILLDIMMPVMDGFEVLSKLKANSATRNLPVIIISASGDLKSVVRGIQLGAEDYLPKPFEPALLNARISSSLEKKRLRDLEQVYLKNLEREFDIARDIQMDFLPSELPRVDGWKIAAYFKAAHEVAGDYYDAFLLPDGDLGFVVGDVCGKGVGAALFMTLFRSLIRATCTSGISVGSSGNHQPSAAERLLHAASFTNNYLNDVHADANMFSTIFIGIIGVKTNRLAYINCGNESPLLLRGGKVVSTLKPTGPVAGILPDAVFQVNEIQIEAEDMLLAYTDGVPDAINNDNQPFGNARLIEILQGLATSPEESLEYIQKKLAEHMGSSEQFDDITILSLKRCGEDGS